MQFLSTPPSHLCARLAPLPQDYYSLSGGERSSCGLILLSAIARVAGNPCRMLDEFDVFQDDKSRKLSMDMLIEDAKVASQSTHSLPQYILLTPHEVASAVGANKDIIKIHRLKNPERA